MPLSENSWRLSLGLRLATVPVSIISIVAFSQVIVWDPRNGVNPSWEWGIIYLKESAFLPTIISLLYTLVSFAHYIAKRRPISHVVDVMLDVVIFVVNIVPISYTIGVNGPMQWMTDGSDPTGDYTLAGRWEIVGVVGLCVLEFLHLLLILIASRALRRRYDIGGTQHQDHDIDGSTLNEKSSKSYLEYVKEIERAGSATIAEISAREISAERARIEERSGVKGYDYGNSWAKLV